MTFLKLSEQRIWHQANLYRVVALYNMPSFTTVFRYLQMYMAVGNRSQRETGREIKTVQEEVITERPAGGEESRANYS